MDKNLPLVLILDFGTQSLRASLTNDKGEIENIEKFKYDPPYYSESYGYAEQGSINERHKRYVKPQIRHRDRQVR